MNKKLLLPTVASYAAEFVIGLNNCTLRGESRKAIFSLYNSSEAAWSVSIGLSALKPTIKP